MTTKTAALLCVLALPFGALAAAGPCRAQTKPAVPFAPPSKPTPEEEAARDIVERFHKAFAQLVKVDGPAFAVRVAYTDDYVLVEPGGKEITKAELLKQIADGKQFRNADVVEKERKAEGGRTVPLPEDKQTWRPDRYETQNDGLIFAYTSPVQKTHQMLPFGKDGKLIDVEIKILSTVKKTCKLREASGGKQMARLQREETVGIKTYLNGKEQPTGFNTGDAPPKL